MIAALTHLHTAPCRGRRHSNNTSTFFYSRRTILEDQLFLLRELDNPIHQGSTPYSTFLKTRRIRSANMLSGFRMDHRNPPDRGSNPRTVIALFIVMSSLHLNTVNAQGTFMSPIKGIEHYCPTGWWIMSRSYRCARLINSYNGSETFNGISYMDGAAVCEHMGAEMLRMEVFGDEGLKFPGDTVIFPATDFLRIQDMLSAMDIPAVWTGMNMLGTQTNDYDTWWSNGVRGTVYQGFFGGGEPSYGNDRAESNKYDRAVCASREPDRNRNYYVYGSHVINAHKKLPVICQMRAPLKDYFPCINGHRVPKSVRCDGVNDCGDDSDEQDCASRCRYLVNLGASPHTIREDYGANEACTWTIVGQPGTGIKADIIRFETEEEVDFVEITIGGRTLSQMDSPSLARLSGRLDDPTSYYSYNNHMTITFSSDSATHGNFEIRLNPVYTNPVYRVNVPDEMPATNIPAMTECVADSFLEPGLRKVWIFTGPENSVLTFQVAGLNLCEGSFLEVRDGGNSEMPLLVRYNGGEDIERLVVTSSGHSVRGNHIYVYLYTGNSKCDGGCISFSVRDGCEATVRTLSTVITSPGFGAYDPPRYPKYLVCRYYLSTPNPATATILAETFDLHNNFDHVRVFPGHVTREQEMNDTLATRISAPQDEASTADGRMTVVFTSSVTDNQGQGYALVFAQDCEYPDFNNFTTHTPSGSLGTGAQILVQCLGQVGGEKAYFFAQEEHHLMDPVAGITITCNRSRWDFRAVPNCELKWCGFPPREIDEAAFIDLVESNLLAYDIGVRAGNQLQYACEGGLGIDASRNPLTCGAAAGEWVAPYPDCIDVQCTRPSLPTNGNYTINRNDGVNFGESPFDGRKVGSVVAYECDEGYIIENGPTIVCTSTGVYSQAPGSITCENKRCLLPEIPNGAWEEAFVETDNSIQYRCNAGFEDRTFSPSIRGDIRRGTVNCFLNETISYAPACTDIDECAEGECQDTCDNTIGGFVCSCKGQGFEPNPSDDTRCIDIDECAEGTDNCDPDGHGGGTNDCTNTEGSYTCRCPAGFALFTEDGLHGYFIPPGENGMRVGDLYHLNHTCVPVSCPVLDIDEATAIILSRRTHFHHNDEVEIDCQLGYRLQTQSVLTSPSSQITYRMRCENGVWNPPDMPVCLPGTCTIPTRASFTRPPRLQPVDGAEPSAVDFGDTLNYTQQFQILPCDKGPTPEGAASGVSEVDYPVTDATVKAIFEPAGGGLTVTCVFDVANGRYVLDREEAMDCDTYVTTCGVPPTKAGATYLTMSGGASYDPANIFFKDRLYFTCPTSALSGVRNGTGTVTLPVNPNVICQDTGVWGFGSLECAVPLCQDPGRVADAEHVILDSAGNVAPDQSYQLTYQVEYNCTRPGYRPNVTEPLECVYVDPSDVSQGTRWEGVVPTCVDMEAPVFVNCPNETVLTDPFMPTLMDEIEVTDNSGADRSSLHITIMPPGFSPMTPIAPLGSPPGSQSLDVVYTAEDLAGNIARCSFKVRARDKVAPTIMCPQNPAPIVLSGEFTNPDYTPTPATAMDAVDPNPVVTTEPARVTGLTARNVSQFIIFTARATDADGNEATCQYTLQVEAEPCSPWLLPEIANGTKTDVRSGSNGWTVRYKCNSGYAFYDNPEPGYVQEFTCSGPGNAFNTMGVPYCQESETSEYRWTGNIQYCTAGSNGTIDVLSLNEQVCLDYYIEELKRRATIDATTGRIRRVCDFQALSEFQNTQYLIEVIDTGVRYTVMDQPDCPGSKSFNARFQFRMIVNPAVPFMSSSSTPSYFFSSVCDPSGFVSLLEPLASNGIEMRDVPAATVNSTMCAPLMSGGIQIPTVKDEPESGFQCSVYDRRFIENPLIVNGNPTVGTSSNVFCYGCSPGSYPVLNTATSEYECQLVPIGKYKSGAGSAEDCPFGKTCLEGACRNDSSDYIIYCDCPPDTNTYEVGAPDVSYCRAQCIQEGLVSKDDTGLSPCQTCPPGSYPLNTTICEPCAAGTSTGSVGGNSIDDCRAECPVGTFSSDGYVPKGATECFNCPRGFYQPATGQTECEACPNDELTEGVRAVNASQCRDAAAANPPCDDAWCNDQGTCTIDMHRRVCTCDEGWGGDNCDTRFDYCASLPCAYWSACSLTTPGSVPPYSCDCSQSRDARPPIPNLSGERCEIDEDNRGSLNCMFDDNRGTAIDLVNVDAGPDAVCVCKSEYRGTNCEIETDGCTGDSGDPCENGGTCVPFGSGFECRCPPGFGGPMGKCETDLDECATNPCYQGMCNDGVNGFSCECGKGFTGANCESPVDLCGNHGCGANAVCSPDFSRLSHVCLCNQDHQPAPGENSTRPGGDVSTGACVPIDNCAGVTCENGGTCREVMDTFQCDCPSGFTGQRCQHNVNECDVMPCQNGTCRDLADSRVCDCYQGYTGADCESVIDLCDPSPCNATNTVGGNMCMMNLRTSPPRPECVCIPGFTGQLCDSNEDNCLLGDQQCYHGGRCEDRVDDFLCHCTTGWTGKRCDVQVDDCADSPCLAGGTCHDLHDDYLCVCPPNRAGKNCNSTVEVCRDIQPCYAGSTCLTPQESMDGNWTCVCEPHRTGPNCELLRDGCLNNPCLHDGTCSHDPDNELGFSCACTPGYMGPICNDTVDHCATINCANNEPCVNIVEEMRGICLCEALKAPVTCSKDQDLEKDYYFGSPSTNNQADLRWFALGLGSAGHDFSLGFWFRYFRNGGTGTILAMYAERGPLPLESDTPMLRFDEGRFYVYNAADGTMTMNSYQGVSGESYTINDGEWIYCVVTYDHSESNVNVYMETVNTVKDLHFQYPITSEQFSYANVILGYWEDETTGENSTFEGYASHVCLWSRVLQDTQIQFLVADRRNVRNAGIRDRLTGCFEFTPVNGASVYRDSSGESDAGELVSLAASDIEPSLQGCPREPQTQLGTVRPIVVDITAVTDANPNVTVVAEFEEDVRLVNGTYTNVIVGTAPNGAVDTCYYDIVIQAYECSDLTRISQEPDSFGQSDIKASTNPDGSPGNHYLEPACADSSRRLSQPVPDFFTCPAQGAFNVFNQYERFIYPECAVSTDPDINVEIQYELPKAGPCEDLTKFEGVEREILQKANILNGRYFISNTERVRPFCGPTEQCSPIPAGYLDFEMACTNPARRRRKRLSDPNLGITAKLAFLNLPLTIYNEDTGETVNTLDVLWDYWIGQNNIDAAGSVINGEVDVEGSEFDVRYVCEQGQELVSLGDDRNGDPVYICVDCAPGEYWVAAADPYDWGFCRVAPEGFFSPNPKTVGLAGLTQCPDGKTTEEPGAASENLCKAVIETCGQGMFFRDEDGREECEKCGLGFFQPLKGQYFCYPCPAHQITAETGTILVTDCKDGCGAGEELVRTGDESVCMPCEKGFVRENLQNQMCVACSDPLYTTPGEGRVNPNQQDNDNQDCSIRNCPAGSFIDDTVRSSDADYEEDGCRKCAKGFYQDKRAQATCIMCDNPKTTELIGADSLDLCQLRCPAGKETGGPLNNMCVNCSVGFYKEMESEAPCTRCRDDNTTAAEGTTDPALCNVLDCGAGEKYDPVADMCINCTRGEYHPDPFSVRDPAEQTMCKPCPTGMTTIYQASHNMSQCVKQCDSGYELNLATNVCEECSDTEYREEDPLGPFFCESCPVTPNPTRRAIPPQLGINDTQCTLGDCPAGEYADGVLCVECPDGTYNTARRQVGSTACVQCTCADLGNNAGADCMDGELTTGGTGATSRTQCRNVCDGDPCGDTSLGNVCTAAPNTTDGYTCDCHENYLVTGNSAGRPTCAHRCDADWCFQTGTEFCIVDPEDATLAICRCGESYEGLQCDVRKSAQGSQQFIIGGSIGAVLLVLLFLLLGLWICWCFKKDKKRLKQEPTVAPTIYQPVAVPVYDHMPVYNHMPFVNQPPKAGTPVGSYGRSMYIPPASGYYDTQSMAGYNTMQPQPVYSEERVYAEHGATQEFYEDPPDSGPVTINNTGHADYSTSLPNNPYQGATAFSEGGLNTDLYAEVNKMM